MNDSSRYQAPLPKRYAVPPVVRPLWSLRDLLADSNSKESLRREICRAYGVKHCILLDRARSGLYLLIEGLGLKRQWITTSFMHRPAALLLKNQVRELHLCSVTSEFNIDVDDLRSCISPNTQAILATHMYGCAADIRRLREVADESGCYLIENGVHLAGEMMVDGRPLGSWGDAAILSFNVDKPVGGILGGAILTNRDDIFEKISSVPLGPSNRKECFDRVKTSFVAYRLKPFVLSLPFTRNLRRARDGVGEIESFARENYQSYQARDIHRLQASAAIRGMRNCSANAKARIRNGQYLSERLADIDEIQLPNGSTNNSYLYYPILLNERLERFKFSSELASRGIETKWRYHPLHLQSGFEDCETTNMDSTERYWRQHVLLPCTARSSESDLDYIAESVKSVIGNYA